MSTTVQSETSLMQPQPLQRSAESRRGLLVWVATAALAAVLIFLSLYRLTDWPVTWFDEGSHLHVPKTLVQHGVYADISSEGFRYYGPTIGVGPTVMLPIAAVFKAAGIGLWQARLVMATYLLLAMAAFYALARTLGCRTFALIALALLASARAVALLEYGRQVLGEVPGLFFLATGLAIWFVTWEKGRVLPLLAAGLMLGLSMVTKSQNLLIFAPALLLVWVANLLYYRAVPQRSFLITGGVAAGTVLIWQLYQVLYLGPATAAENFALLRAASAGAAFVFSPELVRRSVGELLSLKVYFGLLLPFMGYGLLLSLPRTRTGLAWGTLLLLAAVNLVWYTFASIGWLRYAFPALAISALFGARLFLDLIRVAQGRAEGLLRGLTTARADGLQRLALAGVIWLGILVAVPLALTARTIVMPPTNNAAQMAEWMNANVPLDALVETWEPEMGFLTDHLYHYPPNALLDKAVGFMWRGGTAPAAEYDFVQSENPPYVLVGAFSRWVQLYPQQILDSRYEMLTAFGGYQLYALKSSAPN